MVKLLPTKRTWVTRFGERIKVADMRTHHLVNTIALLRRAAERRRQAELRLACAHLAMLRGEMAVYYCEQDIERLENRDIEQWLLDAAPCFQAMLDECAKRGVDVVL
jgi:hypothetical protein